MGRKSQIIIIIIFTFLATSTILHFHPKIDNTLVGKKYSQMVNLITNTKTSDSAKEEDEDTHLIDYNTLNKFTIFYSGKKLDSLEIYKKEEVRYILETMGAINIEKLKELLEENNDNNNEKIYALLNENLFQEQIMMLDEMLKKDNSSQLTVDS